MNEQDEMNEETIAQANAEADAVAVEAIAEVEAPAEAPAETVATATPAVEKDNKMEIAATVYAQVHAAEPKIEKPRAAFVKIVMEQHNFTAKGAASYYQMQKMEAEGKGKYKHHNKKPKVAPVAEVAAAPVVEEAVTETAIVQTGDEAAA